MLNWSRPGTCTSERALPVWPTGNTAPCSGLELQFTEIGLCTSFRLTWSLSSASPTWCSMCMSSSWLAFIVFIFATDLIGFCGSSFDLLCDGFGYYKEAPKEIASPSSTFVVSTSYWQSYSSSWSVEDPLSGTQQPSLQGSATAAFNSCSHQRHHDEEASLLAVCELSCCHEGHLPSLLEVRHRVVQLHGQHLCATRDQAGLRSSCWTTSSLEWAILEWSGTGLRKPQPKSEASLKVQQKSSVWKRWRLGTWRLPEGQQGLWKRSGAFCSCTGTASANDAYDDAISTGYAPHLSYRLQSSTRAVAKGWGMSNSRFLRWSCHLHHLPIHLRG